MRLKQIIYHLRPINLFIVALTQMVILAFLFSTDKVLFHTTEKEIFVLLILCTIAITIGGYFINDYFDYEIDEVNKGNKNRLTKAALLSLYFISMFIGIGIAGYIANQLENLYYIFIYFLAVGFLFLYASHFKSAGLIGNFVVSIFSSLVIAVIWYVFEIQIAEVSETKIQILVLFMLFIFLSSMAREIVKDCQDIEGDSKFGLKTLPIKIGTDKAAFFAITFIATLLCVCSVWLYLTISEYSIYTNSIMFGIIVLLLISIRKTYQANSSVDFKSASGILKISMALGIIYLLLLSINL